MTYIFLFGCLFLGWSFGRNNLSNVFGNAIGSRMLSLRLAAGLTSLFICLGALFSSSGPMDSMQALADIPSLFGAFLISISIALAVLAASQFGIPVSIVQGSVGALIGWNIFFHVPNNWPLIQNIIGAWFYCPLIGALLAIAGFYSTRCLLKHIKIPLLYRDIWVRLFLILSGLYSAYFLGANNIPAIASPYLNIARIPSLFIILLVVLSVACGALMADRKVITTVSKGLYPLSPVEALVVVLSCGLTLQCFSGNGLENLLLKLHLPTFPLVPVPAANVLVGSIMGVGLAKGHAGFHWRSLGKVIAAWILVPVFSGLICYLILAILIHGRINL